MSIEVKVPALPESVADATIATWHKKVGEAVKRDENILDLETDKVVLEVPAPADGVMGEILFDVGAVVQSGQLLARIEQGIVAAPKTPDVQAAVAPQAEQSTGPGVRRMISEHGLESATIPGSGKEGRITKEDVESFIAQHRTETTTETTAIASRPAGAREEKRVPMSRLRIKIAERLVEAQHQAAMLTTFNEVNLKAVMDLRAQYKDIFEKKHGVKLGFMSFFTKAVVESLKQFPAVNASIDGHDVIYHGFYDIGMAVSTERGLVVPADIVTGKQIGRAHV